METFLIVDDHEIVRQGIKMILQNFPSRYRILEASSCAEVISILPNEKVDYVILDMQLSDGNFFSSIPDLAGYLQRTPVLIYTMNAEKIYASRLLQKGVKGFLSKADPLEELEAAIRCIVKGEVYLSKGMKQSLACPTKAESMSSPVDALSDRELEVVEYLASGLGIKEISAHMKLDITTVSTYRRRAYAKLGVQNQLDLRDKFQFFKKL